MFLKALSTVFIWASNLLADSELPRGINLQPSRTPISLMNIWPTKWLDLGSQALSLRSPCLTYTLAVLGLSPKKDNLLSGVLLWILSSPQGSSINDGIDPDEFAMHYIKLDRIISMVLKLGRGALMYFTQGSEHCLQPDFGCQVIPRLLSLRDSLLSLFPACPSLLAW